MPLLTRSAILAVEDLGEPVRVHIPEWNDEVLLRRPTANDRDAWELYCTEHATKPKSVWRAKLAAMLICDASGNLLFTPADIEKLGAKSAAAVHRIWQVGIKLMNVSEEEVRELEKK